MACKLRDGEEMDGLKSLRLFDPANPLQKF